jgi:hypothetical protein
MVSGQENATPILAALAEKFKQQGEVSWQKSKRFKT